MRSIPVPLATTSTVQYGGFPDSVIERGSDFQNTLSVSTTAVTGQVIYNALLSPSTLVGRLNILSKPWEKFKFQSMKVRFNSSVPATTPGSIAMWYDPDCNDPTPDPSKTLTQCSCATYNIRSPIYQSAVLDISHFDQDINLYLEDAGGSKNTEDDRIEHHGQIYVAYIGPTPSAAMVAGTIDIDYVIKFMHRSLDYDATPSTIITPDNDPVTPTPTSYGGLDFIHLVELVVEKFPTITGTSLSADTKKLIKLAKGVKKFYEVFASVAGYTDGAAVDRNVTMTARVKKTGGNWNDACVGSIIPGCVFANVTAPEIVNYADVTTPVHFGSTSLPLISIKALFAIENLSGADAEVDLVLYKPHSTTETLIIHDMYVATYDTYMEVKQKYPTVCIGSNWLLSSGLIDRTNPVPITTFEPVFPTFPGSLHSIMECTCGEDVEDGTTPGRAKYKLKCILPDVGPSQVPGTAALVARVAKSAAADVPLRK